MSIQLSRTTAGFVILLASAWLLKPLPTSAIGLKKATPPSTPGNFHVTAVTTNSVSFAWTASKAGSDPSFSYQLVQSTGLQFNLGARTSYTDTVVSGGATYSFYIFAEDSERNVSAPSPTLTVTLPAPPPPPQVQPDVPVITQVTPGPDTITVSWSEATPTADIGGYAVLINGTNALDNYGVAVEGTNFYTATEWEILNLVPETTYAVAVTAFSKNGTLSATSSSIDVTTTTPPNTNAPTAPGDLTGYSDGGGEAIMSWTPSTSVNTPQAQIEYRIYVNGIHEIDSDTIGQTTQVYVFPDGTGDPQPVYVVAVDQYGNVSPPSNVVLIDF
jgi:chitodextrinase